MQSKFLKLLFAALTLISPQLAARYAVRVFYSPRQFPAADWEKAFLKRAERKTIRWKGQVLQTYIVGEGPAILLVHGWEGRAGQLGKIGAELVARGYRVIAFDGPAHGTSLLKRTTLVEFAEAVSSALSQYAPIWGVVGHSFGAAAASIALRRPSEVKSLVLVSCPFSLRNVVSGFSKFIGMPDSSHEKMYPIMERLHRCTEHELCFKAIGPDLHMPSLVIHDGTDRYISIENGRSVAASIKNSELVITRGLGHMRILQNFDVINAICDHIEASLAGERLKAPILA